MNAVAVTDVNQRLRNTIANVVDDAANGEAGRVGPYDIARDGNNNIVVLDQRNFPVKIGSKQVVIDWLERDLIKATASTGNVVDGPIVASNAIGGRPYGLVGENILPSAPIDEVSI